MYEFTEMNERSVDVLPSLRMEFNGRELEDLITGYRTLNVGGRELLSDEIETESASGLDGVYPTAHKLPGRFLTVQYRLEAKSNEDFRQAYNLLNFHLREAGKVDVPVRFTDEPDKVFYGRYLDGEEPPFDRNTVVSSYRILCPKPFKYEQGRTSSGKIRLSSPYPTRPERIEVILGSAASKLTIDNLANGQHIILNGAYSAGDRFVIDFPARRVMRNNQPITKELDYLESDFLNFQVKDGHELRANPASELTVTVKGRWL